jgi:hypothetical protein
MSDGGSGSKSTGEEAEIPRRWGAGRSRAWLFKLLDLETWSLGRLNGRASGQQAGSELLALGFPVKRRAIPKPTPGPRYPQCSSPLGPPLRALRLPMGRPMQCA